VTRTSKPPLKSPPPLVTNEAVVVLVGTAIWIVLLIGLVLSRSWLRQHDAMWWIWVAVAGIGAGLTWGPYALWRRRAFLREIGRGDTALREPGLTVPGPDNEPDD
jgi:hypothetical protein